MSLPVLPEIPDTEEPTTPTTPGSSFNPLLLAGLGGLALSGGGGEGAGGLMEGIARGYQIGTQIRTQREQLTERKQERIAGLRREFLSQAAVALGQIDDPDEFEEAKRLLKARAPEFNVRPEELDVHAFPESKKKRLRRDRAAAVLETVIKTHGADKFFGGLLDATFTVDGQEVTGRKLLELAEFPIPKRTVTRPVMGERVPEGEVSGRTGGGALTVDPHTGLPLVPQRVQTGTEAVTEEVFPVFGKRVTLGEFDPRFQNTQFAKTPVPTTKDGDTDSASLVRFYQLAGIQNPLDASKARTERIAKEREDIRQRMAALQTQMAEAKTAEQFRAAAQAWNIFVNNVHRYKPYLGFTQGPFDVPSATAQWIEKNKRKPGGWEGSGGGGVASSGGERARFFSGARGGRYAYIPEYGEIPATQVSSKLSALARTDQEMAVRRARELGLMRLADRLAKGQIGDEANRRKLEVRLDETEDQMRIVGVGLRELAPNTTQFRAKSEQLQKLTARRSSLLRQLGRAPGGQPVTAPTTRAPASPRLVPPGTVPMSAAAYKGQTVQAPSGTRYRSDGVNWYEVP